MSKELSIASEVLAENGKELEIRDHKKIVIDKEVIIEVQREVSNDEDEIITSNNNNVIVEIDDNDREKDGPIA